MSINDVLTIFVPYFKEEAVMPETCKELGGNTV